MSISPNTSPAQPATRRTTFAQNRIGTERRGGEIAYEGEGVDEEGAATIGLDELRDAAGVAGRGRPPLLRPLVLAV